MHINRKVDAAEAARHPLARLYRGYYRIATDTYADLPEAYQMWVGILTEDVMVALEAVPDMVGSYPLAIVTVHAPV